MGVDWYRKGGDIAIAIAQRLADRGLAVELQVVGCHPTGTVPVFVRPFGFLSKTDPPQAQQIRRLFEEADFFVLPTRADCFAMVLSEAAAYGLPVAATRLGGIPELVRESWGSLFSPNATPDEFAEWIHAHYLDRQTYEQMAWSARENFEERLNWDVFCRRLAALTKTLRADPRGTASAMATIDKTGRFEKPPRIAADLIHFRVCMAEVIRDEWAGWPFRF